VTDAAGRFEIKGIGGERVVRLTLEGPTITRTSINVRTGPGKPIHAGMFARNPEGRQLVYYGANFDHTAAPSRAIVGVVRDKDTAKPLAGVTIHSSKFAGSNVSGDSSVRTVTDKDGRYRLVGMPKGAGNAIAAAPAPGQPYHRAVREVGDSPGFDPVTVDFQLKRGVLVRGHVRDKATGKPVSANVIYVVFTDNAHRREAPSYAADHYLQTDEDGSFQLVAFPGRGLLAARGWSDHYRMGVGTEKIQGKQDYGNKLMLFNTEPHLLETNTYHSYVEINPAERAELLTCDVILDPGPMPHGTLLGPDGKPLIGVRAMGLTAYNSWRNWTRAPLRSAEFTVYGLDANDEREVVFIHEGKHLAGALRARSDNKGPLTVKLEPWGTVTGRVVDGGGKPLSGVLLSAEDPFRGRPLLTDSHQTDKEGRFRIEGLAPGVKYTIKMVRNGKDAGQVSEGLTIRAGETRDLGDVQLK
jgi:hypothetical protein